MNLVKAISARLLVATVVFHCCVEAAPEEARVDSLPGYNGTLPSKHYAGYLAVGEDHGKYLYYYFVTSEGNATKDPVVLWLNGGPGCSSFDGFIYEHGPFNFEGGEESGSLPKLHLNPFSWSKVSSVIYLDSPCGVGYSYSDTVDDYNTGDLKTASDTHAFLLKWFEEYPEFHSNPFYISGESYAGIYIPTLAQEIVNGIEAGIQPILNFKGYLVGNGVTDTVFDGNALVPFVHGMGLISDDLFHEVEDACNGSYWNPVHANCVSKLDAVNREVSRINIYDILEPCYHAPEIQEVITIPGDLPESFKRLGETERPLPVRRRMFGRAWPLRAPVKDGNVPTWPQLGEQVVPCVVAHHLSLHRQAQWVYYEKHLTAHYNHFLGTCLVKWDERVANAWLNDKYVRKAIHAQSEQICGSWMGCTNRITFKHDAGSMIKYHRNLTTKGYRALIYSGDHDMCVPFTGTEAWTRSLGYAVIDAWRPWFVGGQVAGYTQGYEHNFTFATIKGSGHTVPEYKPREALAFYARWLAGEPL